MSTTSDAPAFREEESEVDYDQYRTLSTASVAALVLSLLSMSALLTDLSVSLLVIPAVGVLFGLYALQGVLKESEHLTGAGLATFSIGLSGFVFLVATTMHIVIYATEVPEGYERVSFWDLRSGGKETGPPAGVEKYDGKKIFIKGYVYPHDQRYNLTKFVIIPDLNTCCFGGQPDLTDMIEVTVSKEDAIDFNRSRRRLGGDFHVTGYLDTRSDLKGVFYKLDADHVR
jgi:hypothetical protein